MNTKQKHIIALSGGKDSTAMALRLKELYPSKEFIFFCTPTGNELPEMKKHWENLECLLNQKIVYITNKTLSFWIEHFGALPNWRQRWCTRLLKIEPCLAFVKSFSEKPILYVGLRADEKERKGIYSENVETKFPLREWNWGIKEVTNYLETKKVKIPRRTDCSFCYAQKVSEWFYLWRDNKPLFMEAIEKENKTKHTFRNPRNMKWGKNLFEMKQKFEEGYLPFGATNQIPLFEDEETKPCRVCTL